MFILPDLPYEQSALEPHISGHTISFHYGKHHQSYVSNLNTLIRDSNYCDMALKDIITDTYNRPDKVSVYNNAAQVWNHTFFWHSMKKNGGGSPSGELAALIAQGFGDFETFVARFKEAALSQFGSGWAWLVLDSQNALQIIKTSNADLPLVLGYKALLTVDVWEHSYYLDYQNKRADYLTVFIEKLINWSFAEGNLKAGKE
ncbi:superoxide dismutase [Rickettsiales endosymbiont of Peranema trichophorum]|nr:superoxide dismutase [Rickettsiales endosymbiont of Peranema trichophorum]